MCWSPRVASLSTRPQSPMISTFYVSDNMALLCTCNFPGYKWLLFTLPSFWNTIYISRISFEIRQNDFTTYIKNLVISTRFHQGLTCFRSLNFDCNSTMVMTGLRRVCIKFGRYKEYNQITMFHSTFQLTVSPWFLEHVKWPCLPLTQRLNFYAYFSICPHKIKLRWSSYDSPWGPRWS